MGGATLFFETALAITVRDLFAGPRLVPANSWLEAANQGGQVIGPGVAGLLAAAGLLRGTMLIDALTFGVSLASLAVLRGGYRAMARTGRPPASLAALRRDLADGVGYLAATRLLNRPRITDTARDRRRLARRSPGRRRAALMHPGTVPAAAHVLAGSYQLTAPGAVLPVGPRYVIFDHQPRTAGGVRIVGAGPGAGR